MFISLIVVNDFKVMVRKGLKKIFLDILTRNNTIKYRVSRPTPNMSIGHIFLTLGLHITDGSSLLLISINSTVR